MAGASPCAAGQEAPPARGSRPRRTAAARRAQHDRAHARAVQLLLRSFASLREHRGGQPSRLGVALAAALDLHSSRAPATEEAEVPPQASEHAEQLEENTESESLNREDLPNVRYVLSGCLEQT